MEKRKEKIIVVGGGPAGMMAAIRAAQLQAQVLLLEKNPSLGKKFLLTGKGRCNLTNACSLDQFIRRFSNKGNFLRDAFKEFFTKELMEFFEKRGVPLKVERQDRVFPTSDKASSILAVLRNELQKGKVEVRFNSSVKNILIRKDNVAGVVLKNDQRYAADKIILATGGVSYSFTGSTGDGFKMAKRSGHALVDPCPALVPLKVRQRHIKQLEGLTLRNICLKFSGGKKKITTDIGEVLFTADGVSGPLVLSNSGTIVDWLQGGAKVVLSIDLKPGLSEEQIRSRLIRELGESPKKIIKNILADFLPKRMISVFLSAAGISPDKKGGQLKTDERRELASLFKGLRLDVESAELFEKAMVTKGGVSLSDIDPKTMASRLIQGLYFAGELIDIDGDTGGFNLQAAFSTGYLAGESAASS